MSRLGQNSTARIVVGNIPLRKSKAISVQRDSVVTPVAYFRDDAAYEEFIEAIKGSAGQGLRLTWEGS